MNTQIESCFFSLQTLFPHSSSSISQYGIRGIQCSSCVSPLLNQLCPLLCLHHLRSSSLPSSLECDFIRKHQNRAFHARSNFRTSLIDDPSSPYLLHHSDSSRAVLVLQLFTGDNYNYWNRTMLIGLSVKSKFGFIDGAITKPAVLDGLQKKSSELIEPVRL